MKGYSSCLWNNFHGWVSLQSVAPAQYNDRLFQESGWKGDTDLVSFSNKWDE